MKYDLTKEMMQFIVSRILERAIEAFDEKKKDHKDLFKAGRGLAYYEVLDILKSELDCHGQDLKEYGLDVDLLKMQ